MPCVRGAATCSAMGRTAYHLSTITGPRAAVRVTSQVTLASTRSASLSASKLRVMGHPAGTVLGGAVSRFETRGEDSTPRVDAQAQSVTSAAPARAHVGQQTGRDGRW